MSSRESSAIAGDRVDLLVIGSGPAGLKAAIQAAKLGRKVLVVERRTKVGGVSVHTGTIPSKTLREAVLYLSGWRQRSFYGQAYRLKQNLCMRDLTLRLERTVTHEVDVIRDQLYRNGVEVVDGLASFSSPNSVKIESALGQTFEVHADRFLVATGTKPFRPTDVPFDGEKVIDSAELLKLKALPRSITVVGAGIIGLEYASIFSALDAKVAVVDRREKMLDFVDLEIVEELTHDLKDRGVLLRLGEEVERIYREGERVITALKSGRQLRSDLVLYAAGRQGNTSALNLSAAGLSADHRGRLKVDEEFRTEQPHIFAAGDVIGFPSLASTSMEQGRLAACHAFDHPASKTATHFPLGIYAVPEISTVGLTEEAASEQGIAYEVGCARFRETARGQILGMRSGLLKLIFALDDHRLLGVHIMGEGATEMVHIGQAVLQLGGTLEYFVESVFNYPTLAEAYKIAALDAYNRMPSRAKKAPALVEAPKLEVAS